MSTLWIEDTELHRALQKTTISEFRVWTSLLLCVDENGHASPPGVQEVAAGASLSLRTTKRAIRELARQGLIALSQSGNGQTTYKLNVRRE